ncbi:hypothetical protein GT037_000702 [Alternaria burnsii]|uniref:Uncharacterized protein n=1 Tax=Alternaria burnsii TaxID=1187904 RepID=A0A8H7EIU5_9PLEO|nr:uncharacterized protein GT037_000702 [Alternaria burnsii]KAF7681726.1 hypothetical protein GT037_000702 [Alternaria burnsii]
MPERTGILVLGPTEAGKSSFIATVTGSVLMAEAKAREEKLQRKLKEEQEEAQELHVRLQQNNQSATES